MNRIALVFLLSAFASGTALACGGCAGPKAEATASAATHTATLDITGMTCASCSVTVKTAVNKLDGIVSIDVDVAGGKATVTYDGAKVSAEQIAQAVTDAGYTTTVASSDAV